MLLTGYKAGLLLLWLTNKDILTFTFTPVLFIQHQLTKSSVRFILKDKDPTMLQRTPQQSDDEEHFGTVGRKNSL